MPITGAGLLAEFLMARTPFGARARAGVNAETAYQINIAIAERTLRPDVAGWGLKQQRRYGFQWVDDMIANLIASGKDTLESIPSIGPLDRASIAAFLPEGFSFEDFGRIEANSLYGNAPEQRRESAEARANLLSGRPRWFHFPEPEPKPPPPPPAPPPPKPEEPKVDERAEGGVHLWSREGTQVISLSASGSANAMAQQKQYTIKVFDQDGTTFRTNIAPNEIRGAPTFRSQINGGFGELKVDLVGSRFKFDGFSEGTNVDFMNIVQVTVIDKDNPRGRTIYKGWVSEYEPYVSEHGEEGVTLTVLHLTSLLSASYYKSGTNFTVTHTAQDPETIGRAIIDHFLTIFGGSLLSYSGATTDPTGVNVTFSFVDQKWFDALKKTGDMAGNDWWWKIDETGQYWLKPKPSSATHTFTLGRDAQMVRAVKSAQRIVNDVQVRRTGGTATDYSDATSQVTYGTGGSGKWTKIISDTNISNAATADAIGNKEVNDNKDAKIAAIIVVNNEFDLEAIKVGETCKIKNYDKDSTFFNENMLIAQVDYRGDTVTLQLSNEPITFARELDEFVNG